MSSKLRPTPPSGSDRKALVKELAKPRAMTGIFARQSEVARAEGEALIRKPDDLACESFNERMWSDGGPAQPSPTIGQALNVGYPWLEVHCSRCKTISSVDLAALRRPQDTFVHQIEGALRCRKCSRATRMPPQGGLHQLTQHKRHERPED